MKKKILLIYLILLFNFVILKFYGNIHDLIDRINTIKNNRNEGFWNINFTSIIILKQYLSIMKDDILHGNIINSYALLNIMGNIIPFIPFGILVPLNYKKFNSYIEFFILSSFFIISLEIIQFITLLGICDIQDYMLNIFGCSLGYIIFKLYTLINKYYRLQRNIN